MTFEQFSQATEVPRNLSEPLQALWLAQKGQWEEAHGIVQKLSSPSAAWVHALLHRQEGDQANAEYWYHRAGKNVCTKNLDEELEHIVRNLLSFV